MYQEGEPCSSCPENSCCGQSCENSTYDGLCRKYIFFVFHSTLQETIGWIAQSRHDNNH